MTCIVAICTALLKGRILTIKTAFVDFGVTNLPREISRGVEQKFDVRISKVRQHGKTRYGQPCTWFQYRLNKSAPENQEGIRKMQAYILKHMKSPVDVTPDENTNAPKLF
jgi:hypothetical protein